MMIAASMKQTSMAEALDATEAAISRRLNGTTWFTANEIRAWVEATGGDQRTAARLVAALNDARTWPTGGWEERLAGGHQAVAQRVSNLIETAGTVDWFEFDVVPGIFQTARYAEPVIRGALNDVDAAVDDAAESAAIRHRQLGLVAGGAASVTVVMTEPGLGWSYAHPDTSTAAGVMVEQLNKIRVAAGLANVTIAIIPSGVLLPRVMPYPFVLFDRERVLLEDSGGSRLENDTGGVFARHVDQLVAMAATGDDATKIIDRVAARFL